jgi:hypothetical protein
MTLHLENPVTISSDPFKGYCPDNIRKWLNENDNEKGLAMAIARVDKHIGLLMHDLSFLEEPELSLASSAFYDWRKLQDELFAKVINILEAENAAEKANRKISDKGSRNVIMPFMERNGFHDATGWWVGRSIGDDVVSDVVIY